MHVNVQRKLHHTCSPFSNDGVQSWGQQVVNNIHRKLNKKNILAWSDRGAYRLTLYEISPLWTLEWTVGCMVINIGPMLYIVVSLCNRERRSFQISPCFIRRDKNRSSVYAPWSVSCLRRTVGYYWRSGRLRDIWLDDRATPRPIRYLYDVF